MNRMIGSRLIRLLSVAAAAFVLFASTMAVPSTTAAQTNNFGIDLTGVSFRLTGTPPTGLSMVSFKIMEYMESWGADIDHIQLTNTTGVQALLAGQTDFASSGTDELILGAAAGADIVAVASTQDKMDYVLVANNEIQSVADLEGKTIGMSGPAGYDYLLTTLALQDAGIDPGSVNFVQIGGSGDRAAALLANRVDATTIFISSWFELERQTTDAHALVFMNDLVSAATKSNINTTRSFAEENPDLLFALACANLEAYKWFNTSRDDFIAYTLANVDGATEEATAALYDMLIEIDMYPMEISELLEPEGFQTIADIMYSAGVVTEQVDGASLVDRSYLEAAAAAGCGAVDSSATPTP